jgi:hypothetical protein
MASEAQIEANRRNAQKSTGPRTEAGKARARLNALKDDVTAKIGIPVLPQENPKDLDSRIQQWFDELHPNNDVECELVSRAARLSWSLDRAERYETAHLAHRVQKAQLKLSQRRMDKVCDLGRKLLYDAGSPALRGKTPLWVDNPAAFLRGLEETAEGCRWLRDRWGELRHVLDRGLNWTPPDGFKLIRLLGKFPTEAVNDPALNAIFLAWNVLNPGSGERFWSRCKGYMTHVPAFGDEQEWRELADRPHDPGEANAFLSAVVDEQIERVEELLAVHEEIAGDEAAELADRASFDPSASFERLRRFQSAKSRELRHTLETFFKLRKPESGMGIGSRPMTKDQGPMTKGQGPMTKDQGPMTKGQGPMTKGQGQGTTDNPMTTLLIQQLARIGMDTLSGKPTPTPTPAPASPAPVVAVASTKAAANGAMSQDRAAVRPTAGVDAQPMEGNGRGPQKGQNEANPQSTQAQGVKGVSSNGKATNEPNRSQSSLIPREHSEDANPEPSCGVSPGENVKKAMECLQSLKPGACAAHPARPSRLHLARKVR